VRVHAIRGATTCDEDTRSEIVDKTRALISEIVARNELALEDVISVILTATDDLRAEFPAAGARAAGLVGVPLLGARELSVDGSLPRCIRVMVHCYSDRARNELRHVYLDGAATLPRELPE